MHSQRKIIHIDMDAFYTSVEQKDNPSLRGLAIAVGGGEQRGVIAAASYEARKFGVRSALSGALAKKLCPHLIFVPARFERYKQISSLIKSIFRSYTPLVEPLSLDEAYLDVTENLKNMESATYIAQAIRNEIYDKTGLHASAGISTNKLVAKIASDYNKPNGQKTVPPDEVIPFLESLDVRRIHGIGKVTALKMYNLGIFEGRDLKNKSVEFLETHFGNKGSYYYNAIRGIHNSPVKPFRIPKSVGAEHTFSENITSEIFLEKEIESICEKLNQRISKKKVAGKTITLKIKYSNFQQQTRSLTLNHFISDKSLLIDYAKKLLFQESIKDSVRLIGVSLSNLNIEKKVRKTEPSKEDEKQLKIPF